MIFKVIILKFTETLHGVEPLDRAGHLFAFGGHLKNIFNKIQKLIAVTNHGNRINLMILNYFVACRIHFDQNFELQLWAEILIAMKIETQNFTLEQKSQAVEFCRKFGLKVNCE